jgi:hypothetical protein
VGRQAARSERGGRGERPRRPRPRRRARWRAHDREAIAAYLGAGDNFERAAAAYADQNERDHATLVQAVQGGRIPAETGV